MLTNGVKYKNCTNFAPAYFPDFSIKLNENYFIFKSNYHLIKVYKIISFGKLVPTQSVKKEKWSNFEVAVYGVFYGKI